MVAAGQPNHPVEALTVGSLGSSYRTDQQENKEVKQSLVHSLEEEEHTYSFED